MNSIYDGNGTKISISDQNLILTSELPAIYITSSTAYDSLTKATAVSGTFTLMDNSEKKMSSIPITLKLQGSGSLSFAKHNLNITFYDEDGNKAKYRFNNWYPTKKIHVKANEYDYSMVRNSVATRFAYKMMGKFLPTSCVGYIDSFPCILYYNDVYMGCHTINLPQDGKTYAFKSSKELSSKNLAYRCGDTTTAWTTNEKWEYRGDEDETTSMRATFTALHNIMVDYTNLTTAIIEQHFDKQTFVAYYTLADIMLAQDSLINNWTIVTWDGSIWYHTWYDLDICFGLGGSDGQYPPATYDITTCGQHRNCGFWQKVAELYSTDIANMYATMRNNGADADTIYNMLHDFQSTWGWQNISAERTKWSSDKWNNNEISKTWITNRLTFLDNKYSYTAS